MPHPMPASQSCAPQDGKGGGGGGGGMRGGERVGEGGHVSHETGQLARPWGKSQQLEQIDIEEHLNARVGYYVNPTDGFLKHDILAKHRTGRLG